MEKRALTLFSIFVIIAVIAAAVLYYFNSRNDQIVSDYIAEITVCGNIVNEDDCYSRDFCEPIYEPTCETCQSVAFKKCVNISGATKELLQQGKTVCESTGGTWYRNRLGTSCLCNQDGMNKKFDSTFGCVDI